MFSFFPYKPHVPASRGFARPEIEIPSFITRHLTQGKKIARDLNLDELHQLWETVGAQVEEQSLMLGVAAELPPELTSAQQELERSHEIKPRAPS